MILKVLFWIAVVLLAGFLALAFWVSGSTPKRTFPPGEVNYTPRD